MTIIDPNESDNSVAMRLVLKLGSTQHKLHFNVPLLVEVSKLFAEMMPREKMLALMERLDTLEKPEQQSITCPRCGMTSYNADDIEKKYCGNCHMFHSDIVRESKKEQ